MLQKEVIFELVSKVIVVPVMLHGEEEVKPGLTKFPGKLQGLVMSKAGLVAAANWLLGPLSFKKQIHGMDCNGNG